MLLAKLVALVVLVQEVKNVDCHPDVEEPRPVVWVREDLLFCITVGVVDKMLRFVCTGNGEYFLNKILGKNQQLLRLKKRLFLLKRSRRLLRCKMVLERR
jgi:hypothetical protein